MKYRALGRTGIEVSDIGFGGWAIGGSWGNQSDSESVAALHRALDLGVNFIDTAAGYGDGKSEKIIGGVIKERTDRIHVATKIPPQPGPWPPTPYDDWRNRYSAEYLRESIEERLTLLGVETIDVLQLHTWTRAWNRDPEPLHTLAALKSEGKILAAGMSTPEHDQNCVVQLMKDGLLDTVQVIYNLFEQEPAAEILPVAQETGTGIIVRVAFDEGALTGKFTMDTTFPEDDFRSTYFSRDRLARTVDRVERIKEEIAESGLTLPQVALKFAQSHPAVSTVVPGIRNTWQAEANTAVSDLPDLDEDLMVRLRTHAWNRAFWYAD